MQKIIESLDRLLADAEQLKELNKHVALTEAQRDDYEQTKARLIRSAEDLLIFLDLPEHFAEIRRIENSYNQRTSLLRILGILQSIRVSISGGYLGKLKHLLHSEMFGSLLEQSEELLEKGHKISSAVLGRIIVERWLRDEAEKAAIVGSDSQKASVLNDELKKRGVFSAPKWRQVQAFLDIGNAAAHGKEKEFTEHDVRRVLDFVKVNCV